ncbi:MAG: polyprenyl synthetase family protein [Bdellovibrionales bacterium]|nr:polyprenyl synthetase family protein [Bdellovibrionales bacterium]
MANPTALALKEIDFKIQESFQVPEIEVRINRSVLIGGKRARPYLCLLFGRLFGAKMERLIPYARASEWVHAATLIHDDVIDAASTRRGKPAFHAISGNSRAVLAGDLLLSRVMVDLSRLGHLRAISSLSHTIEDMVRGEWMQLEARGKVDVSRHHLETVARLKTGGLLSWCFSIGAIVEEREEDLVGLCAEMGLLFGLSFQMIDDTLDFSNTGEKPYAQDLAEGLVNFVTFELLQKNPEYRTTLKDFFFQKHLKLNWPQVEIEHARDAVKLQAQVFLLKAESLLEQLEPIAARNNALAEYQEIRSFLEKSHQRGK